MKTSPPQGGTKIRYAKCACQVFMVWWRVHQTFVVRWRVCPLDACRFTKKVPPPNRRHVFRYAPCVHQTFVVQWRVCPLDACRLL